VATASNALAAIAKMVFLIIWCLLDAARSNAGTVINR
jgi:hypothetical protein